MNDYNPPKENDSDAQTDEDILVADDGGEILTDGGVAIRDETVTDELPQDDQLTEREIAILSTVDLIRQKSRAVEDVFSIATGLHQIVEEDETIIPDPPTEREVLVTSVELRELAAFLEERVAPLAIEEKKHE